MFNKRMDMYSRLRREKTSTVQKRNPQAWFLYFRKVVKNLQPNKTKPPSYNSIQRCANIK